jgi:dTDP-4-dehydrorhamnose reductase
MLGRDVVEAAPPDVEIVPYDLDCDITDPVAVETRLREVRPQVVFNCAAYTAVDQAEQEPELAGAVNGLAPGSIGYAAARDGAFVMHFSTDYVFDGTASRPYREDDLPAPLSVYGRTKLEGERALAASGAHHVIVRTAWLYGLRGRSFPRTMWQRASAGKPTRVVTDQFGRPTFTQDLAAAAWDLVHGALNHQRSLPSLLHVTNGGEPTTWHAIAERVFARLDRSDLLSECTTEDYPTSARRPASSVLDTRLFSGIVGPLPAWSVALDRFLDALAMEAA